MKLSERLAVSISIIMVVAVGILFFNMHTQLTTTTKTTQIAHYQQELHNIKNEMALLLDKAKGVLNTIGVVDSDIENR
ncbi:MAG: hypothetical protein RBT59_09500, partial [Arcobacteraceae bacterium]|nr:hypothetical protein [Arcobacteraceae bacterium]